MGHGEEGTQRSDLTLVSLLGSSETSWGDKTYHPRVSIRSHLSLWRDTVPNLTGIVQQHLLYDITRKRKECSPRGVTVVPTGY